MALVRSGWINTAQNPDTQVGSNPNVYWLLMSDSLNQHVQRTSPIKGAKLRMTNTGAGGSQVTGLFFMTLRRTTGTTYTIIARSPEITSGFSDAEKTFDWSATPMTGHLATDIFAVAVKTTGYSVVGILNTSHVPVSSTIDSAARLRWNAGASGDYAASYTAGSTVNCNGGGSAFWVIEASPLMDPPEVMIVGDSISEGSPVNYSYRSPSLVKDPLGAYAGVLYRDRLGMTMEVAGNTQGSNNANEVLSGDMDAIFWAKTPRQVHVHVGVNDIADFWGCGQPANWYGSARDIWTTEHPEVYPSEAQQTQSIADHLLKLDAILAEIRANGASMLIDDIFPWTGNGGNTTGSDILNRLHDRWNVAREAWAAANGVFYMTAREALGKARTVAKTGDPAPPAGNLWDLQAAYQAADNLGVHLTLAGCQAAANALLPNFCRGARALVLGL